ncbi:glycosyltransferase [Citreimonas salinaria]|uniref:Glycosyltransferase involved in cell wall bisynthesis n=1 Tax=Citreimonas salinaria TaxID=321339 RepID=A0A1H3H930_9RHOB|nr:glycosyltransferase [Citreimonas salinaria]SDY11996.1 Glycosyltransferase involved in cell wall bisynthesis [Citreimonas salinaria]
MPEPTGRVLVYAPVSLFDHDGRRYIEDQAIIGLRRWAENFARADVLMPVAHMPPPAGWTDARDAALPANLVLHPLPIAWRPDQFLRAYRPTRARIAALIRDCDYPCFAIGGLFGDWGAVAAFEAARQNRRFAIWTDRVESEVTRHGAHHGPWRARLRKRLYRRPMAALERAVISRATLGLFHGRETYEAYAPYARAAELVHDILLEKSDRIDADALTAKQAEARLGPLRIIYAGRAEAMKGPMDWIDTLAALKTRGVAFRAKWLGDGAERPAMQAAVARAGLSDAVSLPGFVADRAAVLRSLRAAHVFLFCHRTPESPRCLIEALASGTPLLGHDGAYARDLVSRDPRAARLFPMGDAAAMAAGLAAFDTDRTALAGAMAAARTCGEGFDSETVFAHRAELLRRYLG